MQSVIPTIPKPAPTDHLRFEHVVLIPVYNEGLEDIMRAIYSIAIQQGEPGHLKRRAVVLNVNNSTEEEMDPGNIVYKNNLTVFTFMQELIKMDTDISQYFTNTPSALDITRMINTTRDSLRAGYLYIELIDSFSSGNTQAHNTVGFARELTTRYAVKNLIKDENSLLFSTDADCIFGSETMAEADKMFSEHNLDLSPLNMDYHFHNIDSKSSQVAVRYRLSRLLAENLVNLFTSFSTSSKGKVTNSVLIKKAFNVGGAFTVIRAGAFARSLGYPPDDHKEDLRVVSSVVEAGGIIGDLRDKYPKAVVYTSPRISNRVPSGYGTKIARFSRDEPDFSQYKVTHIDAQLGIITCIQKIENQIKIKQGVDTKILHDTVNNECSWINEPLKSIFVRDLEGVFSNAPFKLYSDAHWDLSNKTKRLLRDESLPQQTIYDQVKLLESIYEELGPKILRVSAVELEAYQKFFLHYGPFRKYLFSQIDKIPNLDAESILPVASCCVANSYFKLYVPKFRELIKTKQSNYEITALLMRCESQLLEVIMHGYKGELGLEVHDSISKRLEDMRNHDIYDTFADDTSGCK